MPVIDKILKPTLLLDVQKCRRNIHFMAQKARNKKLIFRPHFKTHQDLDTGNWFKEEGVKKICVSSVDMAVKFSNLWHHILIAFPVNIREIDGINGLANSHNLSLLIESTDTATFLMEKLEYSCNFYIKIDTGYHRTGIAAEEIDSIKSILNKTKPHPNLHFEGFLVHAGNTYEAASVKEIEAIHRESQQKLISLLREFKDDYPGMIISTGDTPSCSLMEDFTGIDEIRPGNFVFYDVMQARLGACSFDDIAVAVACPVVAKHKERNEIVIYGGAVHLSKDFISNDDGSLNFGLVAAFNGSKWGKPLKDTYIRKLSQEHGVIKTNEEDFESIKIGQLLAILPIHSCLTADAMKFEYLTV